MLTKHANHRAEGILTTADDESMFFAPSIYNLLAEHRAPNGSDITPTGHVLSLSAGKLLAYLYTYIVTHLHATGNAEGLGQTRTIEMRAACLMLGISSEHCIALDQE
jgi:hypothetical protein